YATTSIKIELRLFVATPSPASFCASNRSIHVYQDLLQADRLRPDRATISDLTGNIARSSMIVIDRTSEHNPY
ncbi:MAG: hypothetical protein RBS30_07370, partial [Sphaerochaetaceae bacterium]|nr:hypothetical protein [Sphaerochaetaceae bacterium]